MSVARRTIHILPLLLPLALPLKSSAQTRPPGAPTAIGRALLDHQVALYGRISNASWDQDITSVLTKLQEATDYPGLRISFVVVGNHDVNAAAVPGGSLVVDAGLLQFLGYLAKSAGTPQGQRDRFVAYLAAVLSHELAHITLGHTDSLTTRIARLASEAGVPDSALDQPDSYRSVVGDTGVSIEWLEHSRERELAADRVGSLYLLRAGWTIQAAMDLMRALDSLERTDPSFYESVTYVRTHPRASTREAWLEAFRAQLKSLQADYDDAVTLIRNNVGLPTAIALLDTLLNYFPAMLPALHARGTAYHQLWLQSVPVPVQQVRASLTTYAFRFLPLIRGTPGNLSLYVTARNDYNSVLAHEPSSRTLVQAALLNAYSGDCITAGLQSYQAVLSDSLSPEVANNRGVVLFVCNKPAFALEAFQRAQHLVGSQVVAAFLFNTARAMKAAGDPTAARYFRQYLSLDAVSEWAAEARRQLGVPVVQPTATGGGSAPRVQGIALGYSIQQVYAAWGTPTSATGDSVRFLTYQTRGVRIAISPGSEVVLLALLTRDAGGVDNVRVGDPITAARAAWGLPAEQRDGYLLFNRGKWTVAAGTRGTLIGTLAILTNE